MTKEVRIARSDRYAAASIAQYLHELSGRHADERRHGRDERAVTRATAAGRALKTPVLAGR